MGQKNGVDASPPCRPRACAIQDCLARNNYDDAKCQQVIMALYECCHAFYQRHGDDARTPSCPQPDVLRLKLQHTKDGK
ncbi:hypothetical protein E4U22_007544 [Claviceps purpurea]|nr:hypothetical protein E4U12_000936 [Claviceps purpurea]KAG6152077.1 hypothetical protein E4U37_004238 [Claviceps purpurea]KAG6165727.1 hypothetical protein E4U11_000186 [Claviceps purpurea]KAG6174221.1 hypothetical protein E4U51_002880 [Claviceps purpurea]KAG6230169.1 hypothetical protein E4U34_001314 [Claviceps purpurea]